MIPGEFGIDEEDDEAMRLAALQEAAEAHKADLLLSAENDTPDMPAAPPAIAAPETARVASFPAQAPAAEFPARGGAAIAYQQKPAGFDWRRGFVSMAGGDLKAYDRARALRDPNSFESQTQAAQIEDFKSKAADRALARSRLDPNSEASKQAQSDYAMELATYAKIPGVPTAIAAELANAQANAPRMSAAQIDRARAQIKSLLGTALHGAGVVAQETAAGMRAEDIKHDNQLAEQVAQSNISNTKADNQLAREKFEWEKNKPVNVTVKKPGESTLRDYRQTKVALNQTKEALKLLPNVRYTGLGAEKMNQIFSVLPGAIDPRKPEEKRFSTLIGQLRALKRNKIYGAALSKYDIADANSFLANLGNNKEQLAENLDVALRALQDAVEMTEEEYPSISGEQIPGSAPRPAQGAQQAPANPKVDLAKRALADPNAPDNVKAQAKKVLDAAGIPY